MISSIITATYNAEAFIENTILSVLEQNKTKVLCEHVIVDGASQDGTVDIIKKYAEKYPDIIRYISEPDENLYDALNKGIKMARGTYINVQGAGDCLKDDALQKVLPYTKQEIELIYGQMYFMNKKFIMGREHDKYSITKENFPHQAMFFHRKIFEELGGFDLKYRVFSDYAFNIKLMGNKKYRHQFIEDVLADYLGDGISDICKDTPFALDMGDLIKTHLGEVAYRYYKESGAAAYWFEHMYDGELFYDNSGNLIVKGNKWPCKLPVYKEFDDYLLNCSKERIFIFGGSLGGVEVGKYIKKINSNVVIKGYLDNNSDKWNTEMEGYFIYAPDDILGQAFDKIIIASDWKNNIKQQLLDMGIDKDKIMMAY